MGRALSKHRGRKAAAKAVPLRVAGCLKGNGDGLPYRQGPVGLTVCLCTACHASRWVTRLWTRGALSPTDLAVLNDLLEAIRTHGNRRHASEPVT